MRLGFPGDARDQCVQIQEKKTSRFSPLGKLAQPNLPSVISPDFSFHYLYVNVSYTHVKVKNPSFSLGLGPYSFNLAHVKSIWKETCPRFI